MLLEGRHIRKDGACARSAWALLTIVPSLTVSWVLSAPAWLAWHDRDPMEFYQGLPMWAWVGIVCLGTVVALMSAAKFRSLAPVAGCKSLKELSTDLRRHRSARQYLSMLERQGVVLRRTHIERALELAQQPDFTPEICYPKDRWMYPEAQ